MDRIRANIVIDEVVYDRNGANINFAAPSINRSEPRAAGRIYVPGATRIDGVSPGDEGVIELVVTDEDGVFKDVRVVD